MGGVDIIDQKTAVYRLNCKSKYCFHLSMFSDLSIFSKMSHSHIVYTKLGNDISLLNFKIFVAKALIRRCSNRKRLFLTSRSSKQKSHEPHMPREVPTHLRVPVEVNEMPLLQEWRLRSQKFFVLSDMWSILMLD